MRNMHYYAHHLMTHCSYYQLQLCLTPDLEPGSTNEETVLERMPVPFAWSRLLLSLS